MGLAALASLEDCREVGARAFAFVRDILPICRSITGSGVRETLALVGKRIPLATFEVPSGTSVFDWTVPPEWNIRDAYVKDASGRRVIDFRESNLHVVSYSVPIRRSISLAELRPHLHSLPDQPDSIPYRTSYYRESWGFCIRHRDLEALEDGSYEVCIDATLAPGSLTYAECFLAGATAAEVLVYTHTCHPSLANDNAAGIAITTELASFVARQNARHFSYRFVFGPGAIGSITWLARNEGSVGRIAHGLVLGLLGDPGPLTYKASEAGDATVDRTAAYVLAELGLRHQLLDFSPYGYDERQFCSPGFALPVGRLTRSPNSSYPQYHTSADNLSLIREESLAESFFVCARLLEALEMNRQYRNTNPKCEPQLGKRGLYRPMGGEAIAHRENAFLWLLNQSNGRRSLLDIAARSRLPLRVLDSAAQELARAGLLTPCRTTGELP
jgi:aminopeptidase-like protein